MLGSKVARIFLGTMLLAMVPFASVARADDAKVKGEVLVILAKEAEGEFDPKLKQLPALQKPPFNSFKAMKVLSTTQVELGDEAVATVALPNGRSLQLKLVERTDEPRPPA